MEKGDFEYITPGCCNAGFYSLELAKRGAEVTAIDIDLHYLEQARWAAGIMGLKDKIQFCQAIIYDLPNQSETYDLIWFMGVLYHLRYSMLALDILRKCSKGQMIFQTMTAPGEEVLPAKRNYDLHGREIMNKPGWPKMAFIEHQLADDPANWWASNHAGVEAMLGAAGFSDIINIAHEIYSCVAAPISQFVNDELESVLRQSSKRPHTA